MDLATQIARFYDRIDGSLGPDECWLWNGPLNSSGYGSHAGKMAHRWAYEHFVGPIPEGLVIDHLCRVRHCENPAHMEAVTMSENAKRGDAVKNGWWHREKTHCPSGHEYSGDNVRIGKRGDRICRTCQREAMRRHRAKRRASVS